MKGVLHRTVPLPVLLLVGALLTVPVVFTGGTTSPLRVGLWLLFLYAIARQPVAHALLVGGYVALVLLIVPNESGLPPATIVAIQSGALIATVVVGLVIRRQLARTAELSSTLAAERDRYRSLFTGYSGPALEVAADGTVVAANEVAVDQWPDLHAGATYTEVHRSNVELLAAFEQARSGDRAATVTMVASQGTPYEVDHVAIATTSGGQGVYVLGRDVSARWAAAEELQRRARQRSVLARLGLGAIRTTSIGTFAEEAVSALGDVLGASDAMAYTVADGAARQLGEDVGPHIGVGDSVVSKAIETGEPILTTGGRQNGRHLPAGLVGATAATALTTPVRQSDGPLGVVIVAWGVPTEPSRDDVLFVQAVANLIGSTADRLRSREAAVRSNERLLQITENAGDIVLRLRLRPDVAIEYINAAVEDVTGYSPDQLRSDAAVLADLVHRDDRRLLLERYQGLDFSDPVQFRCVRPDGTVVWLEARAHLVNDEDGAPYAIDGVIRDTTAAVRTEESLRNALERERLAIEQLRNVDTMKNSFLQAVSHELRTPLTGIMGFAVTLQRNLDALQPEQVEMLLTRMATNARKLDGLLGDLLDLDRLTRGLIEPQLRPTDVGALARQVVELSSPPDRHVTVESEDVWAMVDGAKVERIIENLVGNALKHIPLDCTVWVRVAEREGGVLLTVEDDGPGVPDAIKRTIFEPFRQGPTGSSHQPGTGIGLSLVHRFTELHGGRAWVGDRAGGGAAFHVWLPRGEVPEAPVLGPVGTRASRQVG